MKIGANERNLLIGLLGILIAVGVWMFVASPMRDKVAELEVENAELQKTKDEYEAINAQKAKYEQGIVDLQAEREKLLASFPAGMTKENEIMYWATLERSNASQVALSNIVMANWEEVYADYVNESGNEDAETELHLYKAPVNYTYISTYDGLKAMVEYVYAQKDKKSIENLMVTFDSSTGNLTGSMDMNMYYMRGTGKEVEPVTIPTVPTGVSNVFRATNTQVVTEADGVSGFTAEENSESED